MKPTHWIEVNGVRIPEFFCPVCGKSLILSGGGLQWDGTTDTPDTVTCLGCGFSDHIEW